jgi:hypothetical protein
LPLSILPPHGPQKKHAKADAFARLREAQSAKILLFHSFENHVVAARAVNDAAVHAADGSGARTRNPADFLVGDLLAQQPGNLQTLADGLQLRYRADIFEERIAFVPIAKLKDRIVQIIEFFAVFLWAICHACPSQFQPMNSHPQYSTVHSFVTVLN